MRSSLVGHVCAGQNGVSRRVSPAPHAMMRRLIVMSGAEDFPGLRRRRFGLPRFSVPRNSGHRRALLEFWQTAAPAPPGDGVWRWLTAASMTREAALLLFNSVHVIVNTPAQLRVRLSSEGDLGAAYRQCT
jgi:hypothetical protein